MTLAEKIDFMHVKLERNARRLKCQMYFFLAFSLMFACNFGFSFYKSKEWAHYIATTGKLPWTSKPEEIAAAHHKKVKDGDLEVELYEKLVMTAWMIFMMSICTMISAKAAKLSTVVKKTKCLKKIFWYALFGLILFLFSYISTKKLGREVKDLIP